MLTWFQDLDTEDALREHLHSINEAGENSNTVGVDARGTPFLVQLIGPYAEHEAVLFNSLSDGEVGFKGESCDECGRVYGDSPMSDLHFPVRVVIREGWAEWRSTRLSVRSGPPLILLGRSPGGAPPERDRDEQDDDPGADRRRDQPGVLRESDARD